MRQILILTPDGVGSTFLQRAICMFGNLADEQWINIHEVTNGIRWDGDRLHKDWSLEYSQTLVEIQNLLLKNRGNLIARLASYHIDRRKDTLLDRRSFYGYLSDNFTCVACYRSNIFEYAHSWTIREHKNVLNVYSFAEKSAVHPQHDRFDLDSRYFARKLKDYDRYAYWVEDNFDLSHAVDYDDLETVDGFIAGLIGVDENIFSDRFGISLYEYCHLSNLPDIKHLPRSVGKCFADIRTYAHSLVKRGLMPNSLPLKMNSFESKITKTANFEGLLSAYNDVAKNSNHLPQASMEEIRKIARDEQFGFINRDRVINSILARFT